jgi:Secretion system C-terminal sorting domain
MKRYYSYLLAASLMIWSLQLSAQKKYVDEVFGDADIAITNGVKYATNIDFLTSKFTNQGKVIADLTVIKTAVALKQAIPATYYNPFDTNSVVKVTDLKMDVYAAKSSADTTSARPVIIFLHTGNFLPPGINGTPNGFRNDSSAQYLCQQWAKRGYVAISASYRLGWNPLAPTVQERRGQLLNAVYRAIHDVKRCVMNLRMDAAGANAYSINPAQIALYGEGTGAYIALAYSTMDKHSELELTKFLNPLSGKSYIDTLQVGGLDGAGGLLNLYGPPTTNLDVVATVSTGGALADTSWLEAGDAPMIALHCIRDPFAPFNEGIVIVPTTGEDVVEVQGANLYIEKAVNLGNNDVFKGMPNDDMLTSIARSKYGKTFDYIYPAPRDKMTLKTNLEGLYALDVPAGASVFENASQPMQWWDCNSPAGQTVVAPGPPPITACMAAMRSNPNIPARGKAYIDTIQGYMLPRLCVIMGYCATGDFVGINDISKINANIFPNPTTGIFNIDYEGVGRIQEIVVRDVNGRVMTSVISMNQRSGTVDVSALSKGHYFVELVTDAGTTVKKIQLVD